MDFSCFGDAAFDPKEWVNTALQSAPTASEGAPVDTHASGLVMKLQMYIQEVNNSLESTSQQVVDDLPRVIRSVDIVQQEVVSLKDRIAAVKEDVERVERDTAASMRLLSQLDEVKCRMEATSAALQEADNWETLSAEVDQAFASNDLPSISSTLLGMKRSLMVLLDVPDYADRQARLAALEDKLEAMVSPLLQTAFAVRDDAAAASYIMAFKDIGREKCVLRDYTRCHTTKAQSKWAELCADESKSLPEVLGEFYRELLELWQQEIEWASKLFAEAAADTVVNSFVQIFETSTPSVSKLLADDLSGGGARSEQLDRVLQSYAATVTFAQEFGKVGAGERLNDTLFRPFFEQQKRYQQLQLYELQQSIPTFTLDGSTNRVAPVRDAVPRVITQMEKAVARCFEFTAGAAAEGLLFCLNEYLKLVASRLVEHVERFPASDNDWGSSGSAFVLIEASGQLFTSLATFEVELRQQLVNASTEAARSQPWAVLYLKGDTTWPTEVGRAASSGGLLAAGLTELQKMNEEMHNLVFQNVLHPLQVKLVGLQGTTDWMTREPEGFSLSPLPYITAIGEQLLTLPQQLEPYCTTDTSGADMLLVALRAGPLPKSLTLSPTADVVTVDHWLESVCKRVGAIYVDSILQLTGLSSRGCAQLSADIEYLCNVMSALDVTPGDGLLHINQLVAVDESEFTGVDSVPQQLIERIAKMRGISL